MTQYDIWINHIDETQSPDIAALKSTVMDGLSRIAPSPHHNRPFNENAYLIATQEAMFLHNHGTAYRAALLQMSSDGPTPRI